MLLEKIKQRKYSQNASYSKCYHSWLINIEDFLQNVDQIKCCLSDEEIRRSQKVKDDYKRNLYILRKGITRIVLSDFLNVNSIEIGYRYNAYGKPYISNDKFRNVYFNISHSKQYLLIGITRDGEIGVDIENNRPRLAVPIGILSEKELHMYNRYDDSQKYHAFYKAWVQKEALCKALGVGITIEFNSISVNISPFVNYEEYYLSMPDFKSDVKMMVESQTDYVLSTAILV